jgi:hypothetical protein
LRIIEIRKNAALQPAVRVSPVGCLRRIERRALPPQLAAVTGPEKRLGFRALEGTGKYQ